MLNEEQMLLLEKLLIGWKEMHEHKYMWFMHGAP